MCHRDTSAGILMEMGGVPICPKMCRSVAGIEAFCVLASGGMRLLFQSAVEAGVFTALFLPALCLRSHFDSAVLSTAFCLQLHFALTARINSLRIVSASTLNFLKLLLDLESASLFSFSSLLDIPRLRHLCTKNYTTAASLHASSYP